MSEITLREVCQVCGVSRRAVQGYEKAGLVIASGKNRRGYLLYNEESRERISRIKLFQEMGFSINDIKRIIDAPASILKPALEGQIEILRSESEHKELMIQVAYEMIEQL